MHREFNLGDLIQHRYADYLCLIIGKEIMISPFTAETPTSPYWEYQIKVLYSPRNRWIGETWRAEIVDLRHCYDKVVG